MSRHILGKSPSTLGCGYDKCLGPFLRNQTCFALLFRQERTLFVWGFDKASTSLDDLIEYFENGFRNVVNIRQRTAAAIAAKEDMDEEETKEVDDESERKQA